MFTPTSVSDIENVFVFLQKKIELKCFEHQLQIYKF